MKTSQALKQISEVTTAQWGLITAAQARLIDIERMQFSRLAHAGHLEQVIHGVYKFAGAPIDRFETIKANWLATYPEKWASTRLSAATPDCVVSGVTAARLCDLGDFEERYVEFSTPGRKQSQRAGIRFKTRVIAPEDITYAQGLPVTAAEKTVVDLLVEGVEIGLAAQVLADAAQTRTINYAHLEVLLDDNYRAFDAPRQAGSQLVERLMDQAGLSAHAVAVTAIAKGLAPALLRELSVDKKFAQTILQTSEGFDAMTAFVASMAQQAEMWKQSGLVQSVTKLQAQMQDMGAVMAKVSKVNIVSDRSAAPSQFESPLEQSAE